VNLHQHGLEFSNDRFTPRCCIDDIDRGSIRNLANRSKLVSSHVKEALDVRDFASDDVLWRGVTRYPRKSDASIICRQKRHSFGNPSVPHYVSKSGARGMPTHNESAGVADSFVVDDNFDTIRESEGLVDRPLNREGSSDQFRLVIHLNGP
jgi:hypothetical protein